MARVATRLIILGSTFCILSGCGASSLYDWGSYEGSLDRQYRIEPPFQIHEEIQRLSEEIDRATPGRVPPGKAAHLGYLHSLQGNSALASEYFTLEKTLFPESTVLMDRLLKGLPQNRGQS